MRSSKKPNARQLTSTLMAIVMTATTTFQMPNIALASETESSVAVESQIEEVTTKEASSVEVQSETATQVSDEVQATVAETTAEVTCEEEKTTLSAKVDPSGEDTEESDANETRGPDEELTTEIETEAQTDAASEEETEASTEEALIDLSTATKSWKYVYRIPSSRYQYCFTEQYVSDMGTLYGRFLHMMHNPSAFIMERTMIVQLVLGLRLS